MRQFAQGGFRIWNLGREAKIVYTGFGLFALLALLVSVLFYEDLVGPRTAGVGGYYGPAGTIRPLGDAPPSTNGAPALAAPGPRVELPDEPPPLEPSRMTYRKLLEVTHFHLFTVPVFLLIIAHLFMLTGLSSGAKSIWIATGWLSSLLHLAAPWLIHYASPRLAALYPLSGAAMAASLTVMTVYPIVVMWRGPRAARAGAADEPPR